MDIRRRLGDDILMVDTQPTLLEMAQRGETRALEDCWLTAIEDPNANRQELLEVLNTLTAKGLTDSSAALGWTWLAAVRERVKPADVLALGRELLLCCGDQQDLRNDVLALYRAVHADRPELEPLIKASGLAGGKSPRRALRTIDICLALNVGDFLIDRSSDKVAQLITINAGTGTYTIRVGPREHILGPDALTLAYDPVDPNDFRVLTQVHPEKLSELAWEDPLALVVGVLQSRPGRIDSDHLEHLLCPRVIPADKWAAWWSRAKTALRRSTHVLVEGRNPIVLTYYSEGQTLEEEIEPQWARAETTSQRLAVVDAYLREAKARHVDLAPALVERMYKTLRLRVDSSRKGSPGHALAEALIIDRLAGSAPLPGDAASVARELVAKSRDHAALLAHLPERRLYLQALEQVRQVLPDRWQDVYLQLLPTAPPEGCDAIATALHLTGRLEDLRVAVANILADIGGGLDAVCWLWQGPTVAELEPVPRRELLPRLLDYINTIILADDTPPSVLRHARAAIRATLGADNYRHFRGIIAEMDPGMALTVYRTVDRLQGLGQVVHSSLLRIIREAYPQAFAKLKTDPWLDDNIIFCTAQGMQKCENEINYLVNVKIPENAKAIGEAAAHGDLSENSEFRFALEERDLLQARLLRMQEERSLVRLLTANDIDTSAVNVGTKVTLVPTTGGQSRALTIIGPWEADMDKRIYNYRAPLCVRLKGLAIGDAVKLDLDGGECEYRIQAIENALG